MRMSWTRNAGLIVLGLSIMLGEGCKRQPPPVVSQPTVPPAPRVATPIPPDFSAEPPPDTDAGSQTPLRRPRRRVMPQVNQPQGPTLDQQAIAEAQKRRDAKLLEQQTAASQRQQEELNGVVQKSMKIQQDQQAEPRIQEAPQVPITQPAASGPDAPRIQDNPVPPQTAPPAPQDL
jgi:hypothetical protein